MARSQLSDPLLTNQFHLLDVSPVFPPVLVPLFGFNRVTMPTLSAETIEIIEGNFEYPTKLLKKASVTNVTLEQGVQIINSDFYDWITKAIVGQVERRNLLLVQFHRANFKAAAGAFTGGGGLSGAAGLSLGSSKFPFEFIAKMPGKAWLLKRCLPVSYRPGSDLDAAASEISLASLEILVEEFEELSFGI